jgi:hypothetical protein
MGLAEYEWTIRTIESTSRNQSSKLGLVLHCLQPQSISSRHSPTITFIPLYTIICILLFYFCSLTSLFQISSFMKEIYGLQHYHISHPSISIWCLTHFLCLYDVISIHSYILRLWNPGSQWLNSFHSQVFLTARLHHHLSYLIATTMRIRLMRWQWVHFHIYRTLCSSNLNLLLG